MFAKFSLNRLLRRTLRERDVPVLRRADSHPDAPARRPIRAAKDLGQPLPMNAQTAVPDNRPIARPLTIDLPNDLETPLAALDPESILATPREPVRPVASLARPQIIDPGERFETFDLTPIKRGGPTKAAAPALRPNPESEAPASIGTLLDRLEKKTGRDIRPGASIDETLGMLRKLVTQ